MKTFVQTFCCPCRDSGLDYDKQLSIKTMVDNRKDFDEIAKTHIQKHHRIHVKERRYDDKERKPFTAKKGNGHSSGQRPRNWSHNAKRFAHLADYDASGEADPAIPDEPDDEFYAGFSSGTDDDEAEEDIADCGRDVREDWSEKVAEARSDQIQCELMAFFARGKSKGKGFSFQQRKPMQFKGRRNIPSLED